MCRSLNGKANVHLPAQARACSSAMIKFVGAFPIKTLMNPPQRQPQAGAFRHESCVSFPWQRCETTARGISRALDSDRHGLQRILMAGGLGAPRRKVRPTSGPELYRSNPELCYGPTRPFLGHGPGSLVCVPAPRSDASSSSGLAATRGLADDLFWWAKLVLLECLELASSKPLDMRDQAIWHLYERAWQGFCIMSKNACLGFVRPFERERCLGG